MSTISQHESLSLDKACDILRTLRIHEDMPVAKKEFLYQRNGKLCFPRSELVAVGGKAKSGKTFLTTMLMAAAECGHTMDIERVGTVPLRVLWIDTEQSEDTTYEIMNERIRPLTEGQINMQRLIIFNLRSVHWQDRLDLFKAAVWMSAPDLVIFDGIRDVVADINDYDLAQQVIDQLLTIASETRSCIVCVLHQNKASEDKNLRGALGTELMNKAFEVYECQKNPETHIFTVSQTATRKYDQKKLSFMVDEEGLPRTCFEPESSDEIEGKRESEEKNITLPALNAKYIGADGKLNLKDLFSDAIPQQGCDYFSLKRNIMQLANIQSFGFACTLINEAEQKAIIGIEQNNGKKWFTYLSEEVF